EPLPPQHPLLQLPAADRERLLVSPHLSGVTWQAFHAMIHAAFHNIMQFYQGRPVADKIVTADE
ncbi:MAG: 3-phosphoglycerate dehydrogenase, partial [Firmicutes bacterium]|nr:3-phosphoglycerate dehydrogenase [Bacillota bacterium]